MFFLKIILW